jgi:cell division protein FtsB
MKISIQGLRAALAKLSSQVLVLLLIVGLVTFIGVFVWQSIQIKKMEADYQQKKTELAAVQERNDRLQEHLDFYNSPGYMLYVEKVAREALGMSKPGETVILTVPDKAGPAAPATASNPSQFQTQPNASSVNKSTPNQLTSSQPKKPSWQNWFGFFFNSN